MRVASDRSPWPAADCLFLPANDYLWMSAGIAVEVKRIAGEGVETEAVRLGPISLGEVVATGPGNLPVLGVIHGAVMGQDLILDPEAARRSIIAAICLAESRGWKSLLVHSLLAAGKRPRPDALRPPLEGVVERLLNGSSLRDLILLAHHDDETSIVHQMLLQIIREQS